MSNIAELSKVPEISFIDDITLEDIQAQLIKDYQDKFYELTGEYRELPLADPVRLILYSNALFGYQALEYIDRAGKMDLLKYSYSGYLDNLAALKGLYRREAIGAKTTLRFTVSALRDSATLIPGGSRVTDEAGHIFSVDTPVEIPHRTWYVDVSATAVEAGLSSNGLAPGSINKFVDPLPYIQTVTNLTESSGGDNEEGDDDLTYRVLMHPHSYSVAGPKEAYEYWAKTFRTDIDDVCVYTPAPTEVVVLFMLENQTVPSQTICDQLSEFLANREIRPLTDQVTVRAPEEMTYTISGTYYINKKDMNIAVDIQNNVNKAVQEYIKWQAKIGRDLNPSELIKRIVSAGAKRVALTSPNFESIDETTICLTRNSIFLEYGGLEDD